ncbi:MAG: sodium:proton antiporter [Alphaproteobacteria bacterium]|nr:sodium:proton antiporter [Alphaproteobacteria bacterium]
MDTTAIASILISLCAVFGYINLRFIKLPTAIGIMMLALVLSLVILLLPFIGIDITEQVESFMRSIDFPQTLLEGMLSFLLFAGALHVKLDNLREQKWVVALLAGFGTVFCASCVAGLVYFLFPFFGMDIPFIYAMLFGALIAPTDPVAVMAILKKAGVEKSLETKVVGESLFNDGIAVVIFIVLLHILDGEDPSFGGVSLLFLEEAGGGALLGLVLGYITYRLLATIDNYQVEILLTLALVMGGYELASLIHVSGPIMVVVAGLLIGNQGRSLAMSDHTRENLDNFWELCDEFLNAVLFLLIGLEIFILGNDLEAYEAGILMIPLLLIIRLVSIWLPISALKLRRSFSKGTIRILTWGGLRGGISVALALSLPESPERDFILVVTYCIVVFSIIVQGLTIGKVVERYGK